MQPVRILLFLYETSNGCFPSAGSTSENSVYAFSMQARLLPYTEQTTLQGLVNFNQPVLLVGMPLSIHPSSLAAAQTVVNLFLCPSDGQTPRFNGYEGPDVVGANYVANFGAGLQTYYDPAFVSDGVFWMPYQCRIADLTDGASNTLAMSECLLGAGANFSGAIASVPRPFRHAANVSSGRTRVLASPGGVTPTLTDADAPSATTWDGSRGSPWIWGQASATLFNTYLPPNSVVPDTFAHNRGWFAARSNHPGGVNALFCDGRVQFIKDSLNVAIWRGLSTRKGSEHVGEF